MPRSSTDRARSSEGRYMSSILIGASILILFYVGGRLASPYMVLEPVEEIMGPPAPLNLSEIFQPISTGISTLVSVDIPPAGYEFEEEWQAQWRTVYEMLIAKDIDHMNVAYYDHINDEFCVVHVTYLDGREFCWDGESESFSVQ